MKMQNIVLHVLILLALLRYPCPAFAEEAAPAASDAGAAGPEKVDVDMIKRKYWARGKTAEMGVVQNRLYSKKQRFHLGLQGGIGYSDPFLQIYNVGSSLGYFFDETFGVALIGWKYLVSDSSALTRFKEEKKGEINLNRPNWFLGAELNYSVLYGKLSLLGKKIIYYDMHLSGGGGVTDTYSGKYPTGHLGVGQRFFVSKSISIRVDYRLMYFREKIVEQTVSTSLGNVIGTRANWNNQITLGFDFSFGSSSEDRRAAERAAEASSSDAPPPAESQENR